jgi:hypothetical protein
LFVVSQLLESIYKERGLALMIDAILEEGEVLHEVFRTFEVVDVKPAILETSLSLVLLVFSKSVLSLDPVLLVEMLRPSIQVDVA